MTKRIIDILLLLLALPVLLPLFALISLAIWLTLGSPIFFTQERGGYKGTRFHLWKFRSMTNARDAQGRLLPDTERLTPFGCFLRASSLDELPCLWNVMKGEMSIVGPRPLIADYLPRYTPEQRRRHDVKPGLTGWAQIKGRNSLTWDEKFAYDIWYVDHRNLVLDCRIILATAVAVLRRHGISAEGHATMPEFNGSRSDSGV